MNKKKHKSSMSIILFKIIILRKLEIINFSCWILKLIKLKTKEIFLNCLRLFWSCAIVIIWFEKFYCYW
jgi:hypothetical protein